MPMDKNELYNRIRLAGILSYVPLVLFTGPFFGFLGADYLIKKFNLPGYLIFIGIALGFLSSIIEVVRIIKLARKFTAQG